MSLKRQEVGGLQKVSEISCIDKSLLAAPMTLMCNNLPRVLLIRPLGGGVSAAVDKGLGKC